MSASIKFLITILFLSLTACATNQAQKSADIVALKNWQQIPMQEAEYYTTKHAGLPDAEKNQGKPIWGLALSGGGQRSASVSMGFLEALHKASILDKLDVISTVSGGSYAAYWWFTKQHIARNEFDDPEEKKILTDVRTPLFARNYTCGQCETLLIAGIFSSKCYFADIKSCNQGDYISDTYKVEKYKLERYNNHRFYFNNSNRSNLMTFAQQINNWKYAEISGKTLGWLPTIPLHWVANGLFDMRLNLNLLQSYYENGLERDYGFYPKAIADFTNPDNKPLKYYENTTSRFSLDYEVSPPELFASTIKPNNLPYWVINTTSEYSHTKIPKILRNLYKNAYSERLYDNVYEFTPLVQGSPRFGYYPIQAEQDNPFYVKLSRQIAISGAAIDDLPRLANIGADVINLSLGQYINNPAVIDRSGPNAHRLIPFPFYWINQYQHDEASPFIYLSDGGHSDNLGAYSLIRRGVKNIIVLDAEHEKANKKSTNAQFKALKNLKSKLAEEHQICVDLDTVLLNPFDFKKADKSVFVIPVKNGSCEANGKQISTIYYVKLSINYEESELEAIKDPKNNLTNQNGIFDVCKDVQLKTSHDELPLEQQKKRYSCTTRYYATKVGAKNGEFPHDSTSDIFYDVSQFASYTALGYDLGRELVRTMEIDDSKYFEAKE